MNIKTLLSSICIIALVHTEFILAKDDTYTGPDFMAKKVTVDNDGKTVSQIHMSEKGFREIMMTNVPYKIMYISNYKKKKVWMVVPSKKVYSDMESLPGYANSDFNRSTLFDNKPCRGFKKTKKLATKKINKEKIEEWGCIDKKANKAILQWYNPKSKLVIREKDKATSKSDITVSNIEFKSQSANLFSLPSGYKKVTMNELMKMMQSY